MASGIDRQPGNYAGALTEAVHLGHVAYCVKQRIEWDAANLKAKNCPEADRFIAELDEEDQQLLPGLTANTPDNRIICCALTLKQEGKHVVFISKDINARIKSDALGLTTEDFEAQKVDFDHLHEVGQATG